MELVNPSAYWYGAGFGQNDRIIAVNGTFGEFEELLAEMKRSHVKNYPVKHDVWRFLVMDEDCYWYYVLNNMKFKDAEPYAKVVYWRDANTLQDLCCDKFSIKYNMVQATKIFEQLKIPPGIQSLVFSAYNFHFLPLSHIQNKIDEDVL